MTKRPITTIVWHDLESWREYGRRLFEVDPAFFVVVLQRVALTVEVKEAASEQPDILHRKPG